MSTVLTARIDEELKAAVDEYQELHGMTPSQALRMLVWQGLAAEKRRDLTTAARVAAYREGLTAGMAVLSRRVQEVLKDELKGSGVL